jgi:hypothetical protein
MKSFVELHDFHIDITVNNPYTESKFVCSTDMITTADKLGLPEYITIPYEKDRARILYLSSLEC